MVPEHGGLRVGCMRDENGDNSADDVEAKAGARAGCGERGVSHHDTDDLSAEISEIIETERRHTRLANNVHPAVNGHRTYGFGPHDENQGDVVDPSVNSVEEIKAKLGAVW